MVYFTQQVYPTNITKANAEMGDLKYEGKYEIEVVHVNKVNKKDVKE